MIQLMKKDIVTQRKVALFAPVFMVGYFSLMGKELGENSSFGSVIFSLAIAFITYVIVLYSNFNTDEGNTMQNRLILSLPVKRQTVIRAKYLMIAIWWFLTYIVSAVLLLIIKLFDTGSFFTNINGQSVLLSFALTYILCSITYPLYYKFGWKASQVIGLLLFFGFSYGLGRLNKVGDGKNWILFAVQHPILAAGLIALVFLAISYRLSLRIYSKKGF